MNKKLLIGGGIAIGLIGLFALTSKSEPEITITPGTEPVNPGTNPGPYTQLPSTPVATVWTNPFGSNPFGVPVKATTVYNIPAHSIQ